MQTSNSQDQAADQTPELSIIIVSWNTRDMTLEAISSAIEQTTKTSYEMIVLDNASDDDSADAIEEAFPDLDLFMRETENHGFAKANNIAAKHARGKYILLLNPDTITLDGAIDKVVDLAHRTPEAKIWGGAMLYGDKKTPNYTAIHRQMSLWSLFCQATCLRPLFVNIPGISPECYTPSEYQHERNVDYPSGAFFLITRELWEELDGFDLDYVMYGDEADLCQRAVAHGSNPRYTPDAVIVHYLGGSSTVRANRTVMLFKAKTTMVRRFFAPWAKPIALGFFWITPLTRATLYGIAGALTRRASWRETASSWREVFRRRAEWMPGYSKREG